MKRLLIVIMLMIQTGQSLRKIPPEDFNLYKDLTPVSPRILLSQKWFDDLNYIRTTLMNSLSELANSFENQESINSVVLLKNALKQFSIQNAVVTSLEDFNLRVKEVEDALYLYIQEGSKSVTIDTIPKDTPDGEKVEEFYKTTLVDLRNRLQPYLPEREPPSSEAEED